MFGIVVALAGGGCFRPKIGPDLKCDMTPGQKPCPDNYKCDSASGFCVPTNSTDGGAGGAKGGSGGAGGHAGGGGSGGAAGKGAAGKGGTGGSGGGAGEKMDAHPDCLPAVANANCPERDAGGMCDPVCNRGCANCYDKCSPTTDTLGVFVTGTLLCNQPSSPTVGLLASCSQTSPGGSAQQDNCAPGLICLNLECGDLCYQLCRSSMDCTNGSTCSRDAGGGYSFCDVPPSVCDPTVTIGNPVCKNTAIPCYLSTDTKQTSCDCPFGEPQGGGVQPGQGCTDSRDCFAGQVCYDPIGRGQPVCLKVCHLPTDGGTNTECSGGAVSCSAFLSPSSTTKIYGYCPTSN
jgi:hypothetical protein